MASSRLCTLIVLSVLILNACVLQTGSASCCLSYTRRPVRCQKLKGYTIQTMTSTCDITAIIFHTVGGRFICADPVRDWTQRRIACLKEKAAKM